jgi:cation transport regulator ChaB
MPYETNDDLPEAICKGLTTDAKSMARGLLNTMTIDKGWQPKDAEKLLKTTLVAAGWSNDGEAWRKINKGADTSTIMCKSFEEDQRLVFGWASMAEDENGNVLVDRQGDFIDDITELEKASYQFVLDARNGGEMHLTKDMGRLVESVFFDREKLAKMGADPDTFSNGSWWVGFYIDDDAAWKLAKNGDYPMFSIGGRGKRTPGTTTVEEL